MPGQTVYLSLGSNLGEREDRLAQSIFALEQQNIEIVARSSIYETEPQDIAAQPWFLNMAIECRTVLSPSALMELLLEIEKKIGRVRRADTQRGPRPIDLDILLFGSSVIQLPELTVPHPRMLQRRFVLEPLLEIAPHLRHPVTGERLSGSLPATMNQAVRLRR